MEREYGVIDTTTLHAWQFTREETAIGVLCHDKPIIAFNYTSKYWKVFAILKILIDVTTKVLGHKMVKTNTTFNT
ncbi:hypothetical protein KY290_028584 [Solanum tuberosum]|uniref:Uncharacterized protein n=1 Tax=Solanum tuberosum TaxID=4113 RepID=A0ABQ7UIC8_SOLTU|nr:hypothetical protein KY284_027570 [Solanum tuberosum]KAH0749352.1 hypothetical protein KY290_028584 [Solanum tuberosum]